MVAIVLAVAGAAMIRVFGPALRQRLVHSAEFGGAEQHRLEQHRVRSRNYGVARPDYSCSFNHGTA